MARTFVYIISIKHNTGSSSQLNHIRQIKERHTDQKRMKTITLLVDDMIVYAELMKISTKILLELVSKLR